MQKGARGSHEEGCSPNLQEETEDSELVEPPLPPTVIPARKAIRTLEIIASERHALEDRDEQKEERNQEFIRKYVPQPSPQNWAHHRRCALKSRDTKPRESR
jgi:hypothetical protein